MQAFQPGKRQAGRTIEDTDPRQGQDWFTRWSCLLSTMLRARLHKARKIMMDDDADYQLWHLQVTDALLRRGKPVYERLTNVYHCIPYRLSFC